MKRILFIIITILLVFQVSVYAANQWRDGDGGETPDGSTDINSLDEVIDGQIVQPLDRLLSNYNTMKLEYDTASQLKVKAGEVVCQNASGTIKRMRQNTSDTTVTWSDLDTGSEEADMTYYVYAVCDADATTATFKISESSTAPSGVTYYRKLGSFYNDSSSDIDKVKVSYSPYDFITADSNGKSLFTAMYFYGTSTSSYTEKTGDLKVAMGRVSIAGSSTATITNLPFESASSYEIMCANDDNDINLGKAQCKPISGSQAEIYNVHPDARTLHWMAIGY